MRELVGVEINENKTAIKLFFEEEGLNIEHWVCTGDCCSSTWIEHITLPEFPAVIVGIEEKSIGEKREVDHYEFLQDYSTTFRTQKGDALIVEFRNSSNGYYGGSLELAENVTVYGRQDVPRTDHYTRVTKDF